MRKIGFVGAGNMAAALVKGLLAAGTVTPADVWVSDAVGAQSRRLAKAHRIGVAPDNRTLVRGSRLVVLAVKPQVMAAVLDEIRPEASRTKLFVSIAAGFPLARLEQGLGGTARVVRVMPNTPALVGQGASVAVAGRHATAADLRATLRLFAAVGEAMALRQERLLDVVTALSGSGPAFVYLFAEHLIAAAIRAGLAAPMAERLAFLTIRGAAGMMLETTLTPRALREMVTSPGGTTLAGLNALAAHGFADAVEAAIAAADRRARELRGS
jgi:pyrroline-5-carboxylate reductase